MHRKKEETANLVRCQLLFSNIFSQFYKNYRCGWNDILV